MTEVWNLGLPRTGTTSTTEACRMVGLRCKVVFAGVAMDAIRQGRAFEPYKLPPNHPPTFATVRQLDSWLVSASRYFPNASVPPLITYWVRHMAWLQEAGIPVVWMGTGWAGLRSKVYSHADQPDVPYPWLNRAA